MTARPTWIETDTSAIADNMRILRAYLRPDVRWLAVVKADAYGHGADAVLSEALQTKRMGRRGRHTRGGRETAGDGL